MNEKVEGTLVLDGLIEGKIPDRPDGEDLLREWVRFAASAKLRLSLEIDGKSFSLLAEARPMQAEDLGPSPAETIAGALTELLKIFPAEERRRILSTLRSVEIRKGAEVQTLYAIAPDGTVKPTERTVEAQTTPAPRKLTGKEKFRLAAIGVVIALLVFLVSAIFVDYRALFNDIAERAWPINVDEVEVETGSFKDYFTVEKKASGRGGREMRLTLKRSQSFPIKEADFDKLLAAAGKSLSARLAVEALARGYVRCEFFDKKGDFLGFTIQRISGLREAETVKITVALPRDRRPVRVVITY